MRKKPEIYSDAQWRMVQGYWRGSSGLPPEQKGAAYMHGYRNGEDDSRGIPRDRCDVIRRRAEMILSALGDDVEVPAGLVEVKNG